MKTVTTEDTSLLIEALEALLMNGLRRRLPSTENLKQIELLLKRIKVEKWSNPSLERQIEMFPFHLSTPHGENSSEPNLFRRFMNKTGFTT